MMKESQGTNYKESDVVMVVTLNLEELQEKLLPKPKIRFSQYADTFLHPRIIAIKCTAIIDSVT
jgi:hypothetical protein